MTAFKASRQTLKIGRCILAEMPKQEGKRKFSWQHQRLREIERIVEDRYGRFIPETDDADVYFEAVALSCPQHKLVGWCKRWAPWAVLKVDLLQRIEVESASQKGGLTAEACAHLLRVSFEERTRLNIRTIGAYDVSDEERKAIAKQRKREKEKQRQRQKRGTDGQKLARIMATSTKAQQPWVAEGVSRSTWYSRKSRTRLLELTVGGIGNNRVQRDSALNIKVSAPFGEDYADDGRDGQPHASAWVQGRSPGARGQGARVRPLAEGNEAVGVKEVLQ